MSNTISRQDAIDAIDKYIAGFDAIDANFLDGLKTAKQLIKDLFSVIPEPCEDVISRKAAKHALCKAVHKNEDIPCENQTASCLWSKTRVCDYAREIDALPSAQPEPLPDAYMKSVWTWLLDYQIKVAELKGRYTPCEVLSWVANDWRKEHERSD